MGMHIANLAFRPLEGRSGFVVRGYESVDRLSHLLGRGETYPSQSAATQDAEPAFNLIEPTGVGRREVEMDRAMARQPTVMLRFVGIEIVHPHVQFPARIECDHLVHEGKKIAAQRAVEMTVDAKPCGFRTHLGNRFAIPTFPTPRRLLVLSCVD